MGVWIEIIIFSIPRVSPLFAEGCGLKSLFLVYPVCRPPYGGVD